MTTQTLPSTKQEEWRWADMRALRAAADSVREAQRVVPADLFLDIDGPRLCFIDGVFAAEHSAPGAVQVQSLAIATEHPLGRLVTGKGWALTLAAGVDAGTIQIVHLGSGGESHVPARIALAEGAAAKVVESFAGAGWANRFSVYTLAKDAKLDRAVRLVQATGYVSVRDEVDVGEDASYRAVFLGAGGMGSRIDGALNASGTSANLEMGGALLTRGEQRQESAVAVRHDNVDGTSHQLWRAVAAGRSVTSLAARVEVARDAQRTDGEQSLRGLLLERGATVNLKPELEIFADDVKCAHGATVGELDKQALFYLESRGIDKARATALLTRAFVGDAIERIADEQVRAAFTADADAWLDSAL